MAARAGGQERRIPRVRQTATWQVLLDRQRDLLRTRRLTGGNENDVDAKDCVSEPSVEAVEASHLQGGVKHSSST